jgi:predicted Zn-dependent protease
MPESELTRDLPPDLAAILRDQSVIIPQHAAVFEAVAAWAKAPTATASASITLQQMEPLIGVRSPPASTTPGGGC